LAERILATPMTMVSQAAAQVLYGDMRDLLAAGKARRRCGQLLLVMAIIGLLPTLMLFLYAEPIFAWVLGEEWREAGLYASWLIVGLFVQFLYSPLSMVLMAIEGQAFNFLIHFFIGIMKVGALVAAFALDDEMFAIMGISGATMVGYGVAIGLVFFLLSKSGRVVQDAV